MGQKVYVISESNQVTPGYDFTIDVVKWVFTSRRKAIEQMSRLSSMIEVGEWWKDENGNRLPSKVLADELYIGFMGARRDILAEMPNGKKVVYRLSEIEANSGF